MSGQTDLDKWKAFFDSFGIPYTQDSEPYCAPFGVSIDKNDTNIFLSLVDSMDLTGRVQHNGVLMSIVVKFDKDGAFCTIGAFD